MVKLRPLMFFVLALFAGCGDPMYGTLNLAVTDAPVDGATAVVVTFDGVELQPMSGDRVSVVYDAPRQIDLLALQGGLAEPLLDGLTVPAGEYAWVRLMVGATRGSTESYIALDDGSIHSLYIPSGAESGLKLNGGMIVAAGGTADFTVDFDLRRSVHDPMGGSSDYILRPTLRLVDDIQVGRITGTVDPLLLGPACSAAVYAYTGTVTPDDVGGSGAQPISTAFVVTDATTGVSSYTLAFLPAGDYTVALTCMAAADAPSSDDAIVFNPVRQTSVSAGGTTTLDLVP